MRILVIGSGGREHALVWKLKQSPRVTDIIVAPGNGGIAMEGVRCIDVDVSDILGLAKLARSEKVDLVVPGPELPLTLGITNAMTAAGVPCFGPDRYCAQLEGSKYFAKDIMGRAGVPTAACAVFEDAAAAKAFVGEYAPIFKEKPILFMDFRCSPKYRMELYKQSRIALGNA